MGIHVLRDVDLIVDALRVRGVMNSCALADTVNLQEATTYGCTGPVRKSSGIASATLDMEGFYDPAVEEYAADRLGVVNVPVLVAPLGSADGNLVYMFRGVEGEMNFFGGVGEVAPFSVNIQGSDGGRLVRGTIMHNAARQANGEGTARQLGGVAAGKKLYAALHVLSAGGTTPTLDVVVASDDNAGFASGATRITFDQVTAAGSQWKTLAGPITDDYWRVEWSVGGTNPDFTFIVALGIQ